MDLRAHVPVPAVLSRICLNRQHWVANRLREEGMDFAGLHAFLKCGDFQHLQEIADL